MEYKNINGETIQLKTVEKKKKVKAKIDHYIAWASFYYVWRTKDTGSQIVLYEWTIVEKLDNDMFRVSFIDRNVNSSKKPFEKVVPKSIIKFK